MFGQLDLSQTATGLLMDQSYHYYLPEHFDGATLDTNNLLNYDQFGLLYATIYGAGANATLPPHPSVYRNADKAYDNGGPLGIVLTRFEYDRLRGDAVDNNLIDTTGRRLTDVPGRTQSPYFQRELFAATPVSARVIGPEVRYQFDPSLVLTNTGTSVSSLRVDFGDGNGYVTLAPGAVHEAAYTASGVATLQFEATYSDGAVLVGHAEVEVSIQPNNRYAATPEIDTFFVSNSDSLRIQVITACEDSLIRKPFFYVMGFNPRGEDEYQQFNDMTGDFFNKTYSAIGGDGKPLLELLDSAGYDIIYCDWEKTERNLNDHVATLTLAINWVNAQKALNGSDEENIVFARSMGGVVSRAALLGMDGGAGTHETKKLITLDTGHKGNNTTVAAQRFAVDMANVRVGGIQGVGGIPLKRFSPKLERGLELTESPAVRQLSIYHIYNMDGPLKQGTDMHADFFGALEAMGEPQNFEMVCMSNGSVTGQINTRIGPLEKMFKRGPVPLVVPPLYVPGAPTFTPTIKFYFHVWGKSLPNRSNTYRKIYKKHMYASLWFTPIVFDLRHYDINDVDPLDTAPGGMDPMPTRKAKLKLFKSEISLLNHYADNASYTICPTFSALNLPQSTILTPVVPGTTVGPGIARWRGATTNALNYFGQTEMNQKHTSFDQTLATFFLREVITTDGPATICNVNGVCRINEDYNFGIVPDGMPGLSTPNEFIRPQIVPNNRTLHINRDLPLGNVDNPDNPAAATGVEEYEFFLRNGIDCDGPTGPAHLTVDAGGQLLVGDWEAGNTAALYLEDESNLTVNGTLLLDERSRILVGPGSTLRINGDALFGADTEVIIADGGELVVTGVLTLDPRAVLTLEYGARCDLYGDFEGRFDARVSIEQGGIVFVHTGAELKLGERAELVVEDKATLVLYPATIIKLWSGNSLTDYGTACIRIFGVINWRGEPVFSGNGYFSFELGSRLSLKKNPDNEFRLRGESPGYRFLNVEELEIPEGGDLHLSRGIVTSSRGISAGGRVHIENTHWRGYDALYTTDSGRALIRRSTFTDMDQVLNFDGIESAFGIDVRECTFLRCQTGVSAANLRFQLRITDSEFDGGAETEATGLEAIWGENSHNILVRDTDIHGYINALQASGSGTVTPVPAAADGIAYNIGGDRTTGGC